MLNHPFIINMNYAFETEENLYIVMDYLRGGTYVTTSVVTTE